MSTFGWSYKASARPNSSAAAPVPLTHKKSTNDAKRPHAAEESDKEEEPEAQRTKKFYDVHHKIFVRGFLPETCRALRAPSLVPTGARSGRRGRSLLLRLPRLYRVARGTGPAGPLQVLRLHHVRVAQPRCARPPATRAHPAQPTRLETGAAPATRLVLTALPLTPLTNAQIIGGKRVWVEMAELRQERKVAPIACPKT